MSDENTAGGIFISDCYPRMQLNVISSSKHQHMVVSALTHVYYLAMTFHCMCRFSLSPILHLHSPHHFFLFFILRGHLSHVLLSPVISLPSHLFSNPIIIPLPFPSSCSTPEQLPYTLSAYHLSLLYFHLLSYFLQYFIFHTFFLSHHFPFPFLSSLLLR